MNSIILQIALAVALSLLATISYAGSLHTAIQQGDLDQVRQEIANGADVTKDDIFLGRPLLLAAALGNVQIVELLISHGASIETEDVATGTAPLHGAAAQGHLSVVKILIKHGANIHATRTSDRETPLHAAAQGGNEKIVELLISLGADVNARSINDYTPVHSAATAENFEVVDLLRVLGASPRPVAPVSALLVKVDPEKGSKTFRADCGACHNADKGGPKHAGPNLWGIVGRKRGSLTDFDYSSAIIRHGGEWTYETLNAFIATPTDLIPGTKMVNPMFSPSVKDHHRRAEIIAYLRQLSDNPVPLPTP